MPDFPWCPLSTACSDSRTLVIVFEGSGADACEGLSATTPTPSCRIRAARRCQEPLPHSRLFILVFLRFVFSAPASCYLLHLLGRPSIGLGSCRFLAGDLRAVRFSDNFLVFGDQSAPRLQAARARDAVHVDVILGTACKSCEGLRTQTEVLYLATCTLQRATTGSMVDCMVPDSLVFDAQEELVWGVGQSAEQIPFVADTDFHPIFSGRCLFATFSGSRPVSAVLRAAIQGEKSTRTDSGSCLLFACVRLPSLGGCDHSRLPHLMLRSMYRSLVLQND